MNCTVKEKTMNLKGRNFLTLKDFTPEEIIYLIDLAEDYKKKKKKGSKASTKKVEKETATVSPTREEVEEFAVKILESINGPYPMSQLMQKVYQNFPDFNYKNYHVRKAQDFFNAEKFLVTKGKSTELLIELK